MSSVLLIKFCVQSSIVRMEFWNILEELKTPETLDRTQRETGGGTDVIRRNRCDRSLWGASASGVP